MVKRKLLTSLELRLFMKCTRKANERYNSNSRLQLKPNIFKKEQHLNSSNLRSEHNKFQANKLLLSSSNCPNRTQFKVNRWVWFLNHQLLNIKQYWPNNTLTLLLTILRLNNQMVYLKLSLVNLPSMPSTLRWCSSSNNKEQLSVITKLIIGRWLSKLEIIRVSTWCSSILDIKPLWLSSVYKLQVHINKDTNNMETTQ